MKYEDIIDREEGTPSILSESMIVPMNKSTRALCDSSSMYENDCPIVQQEELDSECYTLAESKKRLKAKVHARISKAEEDIKAGRTMSAEAAHSKIEEKYPWLCNYSYTPSTTTVFTL